jgi:hypothetical protein
MYRHVFAIRTELRTDIRINEQYNSLIRTLFTRCRMIGLPLLSSRVNLKKQLGVGTRGVTMKFSSLKPHAQVILDDITAHHEQAVEMTASTSRWATPPPSVLPPDDLLKKNLPKLLPHLKLDTHDVWAVSQSRHMHEFAKSPDARLGIVFARLDDCDEKKVGDSVTVDVGHSVFFCADKNYSQTYIIECKVSSRVGTNLVAEVLHRVAPTSASDYVKNNYVEYFYPSRSAGVSQADAKKRRVACATCKLMWQPHEERLVCFLKKFATVQFIIKRTESRPKATQPTTSSSSSSSSSGPPLPPPPSSNADDEEDDGPQVDLEDPEFLDNLEAALRGADGAEEPDDRFDEWFRSDDAEIEADAVSRHERSVVDAAVTSSSSRSPNTLRTMEAKIESEIERLGGAAGDMNMVDVDGVYEEMVLSSLASDPHPQSQAERMEKAAVPDISTYIAKIDVQTCYEGWLSSMREVFRQQASVTPISERATNCLNESTSPHIDQDPRT